MKSYNLFFILSIVFTLLINAGHAFDYNSGEEREGFYEIITHHPNGLVSDKNSPEYVEYVNGIIGTLRDTIMDNVSTYEDPSKLDELQGKYEERLQNLNLVDDYNNYGYVYQVMEFGDSTLFYAYLSVPLVEVVRATPGIDYCNLPIYLEPSNVEVPKEEPKVEQKQENVVCEKKDPFEDFYSVYVHYPKGEFSTENPEYIKYLNDLIEYIHYIIIKNRSNYQNPRKLDEIQQKHEESQSEQMEDYGKYGTVYRTIANGNKGTIILSAYLNEKSAEEVKSLADVTYAGISAKLQPDDEDIVEEEEEAICFEKDDTVVDEPIQAPELPKIEEEKKIVCDPKVESEGFYTITAKHEYEEFIIEDPEFQIYLADFMKSIDRIIYKNKETYQDHEMVKNLHEVFDAEYNNSEMDFENSGSVKVLYLNEDDGTMVLSAYLNTVTVEEVKKLSIVSSVEQSTGEESSTDEYCHEVEVDSITPEETVAAEVDTAPEAEVDNVQCFSIALGYPCCSQGATVYYTDSDGEWGYEDDWCGISN